MRGKLCQLSSPSCCISKGDVIIVRVEQDEYTLVIPPHSDVYLWVMKVDYASRDKNKELIVSGELFSNGMHNLRHRMFLGTGDRGRGTLMVDDDSLICVFMWLGDEITDHLELSDSVLDSIENVIKYKR